MYVRATTRKNKDGSSVRYLQLAHNEWDAATGTSRPQVLHSFGREDRLDRPAIERLVASLTKLLDPAAALRATSGSELTFLASRPMGGAHALDGLWHRIGIDTVMKKLLKGRRLDPAAERVLFALVANRALAPSSKLAAIRWIEHDSHIPGLPATSEDACYRAMDWLLTIEDQFAEEVYWAVADLLNLEVDLLFFDTTSTYFETGEADIPAARDERGRRLDAPPEPDPLPDSQDGDGDGDGEENVKSFRAYGKSKDHRPDLPQVVIGMAVTRTGIPIRVWSWPGNTGDQSLIRQVREDLREWKLTRVVWVADRGFASEKNRRFLQRAGGHYILGEKIRSGSPAAQAALSRQGRYAHVADNMQVKQVQRADTTDRFVICHNPEQAKR
ncbi:IS1634 family transposase [Streptomyces sp. NPDC005574]|uniref:IS1634 family transposase n=1 Tax=Streptomyces sp. NPDC005574 TaxID=3156891 RepID=UPI0033A3CFEA